MWSGMLDRAMVALIRDGELTVKGPGFPTRRYGVAGTSPQIALSWSDPDLPRKMILNPELALGEGYMDGRVEIEGDDLHGLLKLILSNRAAGAAPTPIRWNLAVRRAGRRLAQYNPIGLAQRRVAHHYDLSGALYDLFLDVDRHYSCAYFRDPTATLEEAQRAKCAHIAGKLCLEPGMRVLDIGCGWGGLSRYLAQAHGVSVLGVTLSKEQLSVAEARAAADGLSDRVSYRLQDHRKVTEGFDRVVSVGMFEHVGVPHYAEYFRHVRDRLMPDGVALIHTIGRRSPPGTTSPFINKYIFPGGYIPALSEIVQAVQPTDLYIDDIEVWRLHYAETLRHWYARFMEHIDQAEALFDARFCRMWRFYLAAAEQSFRHFDQVVFQLQLSPKQDAVPLTRDYLYSGHKT